VLAEIEQAQGVRLAPELLGRLHDIRVAVAVSGPEDTQERVLDLDTPADGTSRAALRLSEAGREPVPLAGEHLFP
jgi:hypothetical protein